MTRKFAPLVMMIVLFSIGKSNAQYYYYNNSYYDKDVIWEIGGSIGLMSGITDVGAKKGFMPSFKSVQPAASIYVAAMYQNFAGLRLEGTFGRIAGADSNGAHKQRNLSYRTPIREIALMAELHPLSINYKDVPPMFSPYITLGMAWFSFNPQGNLNGNWVDLQPLRTEGQGFAERPGTRPYRLSQSNIIGGFGVKYEINHLFSARAEVLLRYTFTDYLDDASTTYVDPDWFDANLSPHYAALARELHDRSILKDPDYSGPGAIRSGSNTNDHYMSFNLKFAINLGRSPIER